MKLLLVGAVLDALRTLEHDNLKTSLNCYLELAIHPMTLSPSLPPQKSFESVFSLQGPVEPDDKNHITSSFSVLEINNTSGNLDIYPGDTRSHKRPLRRENTTAAQHQSDMYKGHMSCFSLAGHLAISPSSTTSEETYALAEGSIGISGDSTVANQLLGNSSKSSNTTTSAEKPPSSIYFHSLLQPIRKVHDLSKKHTNM